MQITTLYLIRHGEAHCNVNPGGPVAGMQGDLGLTELGHRQAERLRDRLASGEIAAEALIASTLPRAQQTAQIIAPALGLDIRPDDEVQEMRVGEADGMLWTEMQATYGIPNYRKNPYRQLSPGGENWGQFVLRVGTALDRIAREHEGKTVVVVTHGGFIDASFLVLFGVGTLMQPPFELYTHNTAITQWERHHHDDGTSRWRLVRYNDDLHVRDIVVDERFRWRKLFKEGLAGAEAPAVPIPVEDEGER
jgi:2,3-bisphosphoglycerate-dependent phosphoglycerate mutase